MADIEDPLRKGAKPLRCPRCGWLDIRLSSRRGLIDAVLSTLSLAPYRCRTCGARFHRIRREEYSRAGHPDA